MLTPQDPTVNRIVIRNGVTQAPTLDYYQLKSRQSELKDQLEQATERREELAQQLNQKVGIDRAGVEERIKGIDGQITVLETNLASVGRDVAEAAPASLSQERPRPPYINTGFREDDMWAAGFTGAGVMLALLVPTFSASFAGGGILRFRRRARCLRSARSASSAWSSRSIPSPSKWSACRRISGS